ncbi:trypsin-like peptidase domain-containing protein [Duganella sp. CF458]|uniref:trypsin-like peptidase domain-containing protein n=1 Tax=Duganella sp. CF458 TaxID=1884368 RepID=UPI0035A672DE
MTLSTGTGFVVDTPVGPALMTNRHNVTGRNNDTGVLLSPQTGAVPDELLIRHNKLGSIGQTVQIVEPLYKDDVPLWVEHPRLGGKADFVALPLTGIVGVALMPITTGRPEHALMARPASNVSVIGFPFGLSAGFNFAIWATGFIASEPCVNYDNLPIFLIDCRTRQGQSGSPVFIVSSGGMAALESGATAAFDGPVARFMGIYSGRINAESDLGKVWKAEAVFELITSLRRVGDRIQAAKPIFAFKHSL